MMTKIYVLHAYLLDTPDFMKKNFIQYDRSNAGFAKSMRRSMTRAEKRIRFEVLQQRPGGYKFLRQKMIGSFILDFYCSKLLLAIEIDGDSHADQIVYDAERTDYLNDQGIKVLRYTNNEVYERLEGVYADVLLHIRSREK